MNDEAWDAGKERFSGVRYAIAVCSVNLRFQRTKLLLKFQSLRFKLRLLRLDLRLFQLRMMSLSIDVMLYLDEAYSKFSSHFGSCFRRLRG